MQNLPCVMAHSAMVGSSQHVILVNSTTLLLSLSTAPTGNHCLILAIKVTTGVKMAKRNCSFNSFSGFVFIPMSQRGGTCGYSWALNDKHLSNACKPFA